MQMKTVYEEKEDNLLLDLNASLQPKLLPLIVEIAKQALFKKRATEFQ